MSRNHARLIVIMFIRSGFVQQIGREFSVRVHSPDAADPTSVLHPDYHQPLSIARKRHIDRRRNIIWRQRRHQLLSLRVPHTDDSRRFIEWEVHVPESAADHPFPIGGEDRSRPQGALGAIPNSVLAHGGVRRSQATPKNECRGAGGYFSQ